VYKETRTVDGALAAELEAGEMSAEVLRKWTRSALGSSSGAQHGSESRLNMEDSSLGDSF